MPVCLSLYINIQYTYIIKCGHHFHIENVHTYIRNNKTIFLMKDTLSYP